MRLQRLCLLVLPVSVLAAEQVPLANKVKGWFDKASTYVTEAAAAIPSPADFAASKISSSVAHNITLNNWRALLRPDNPAVRTEPDEWLIHITGGNKTCFGMCTNSTLAWKKSISQLSVRSKALKFGLLDCDREPILCHSWVVGPPSLYHFTIPNALPQQAKPPTVARFIALNRTASTSSLISNITELITKKKINDIRPYNGPFQPFDGWAAKSGLNTPLAYGIWGFSLMPTWMPMILISLFSRTIMSRGRQQRGNAATQAAHPRPAANR